MRPRWRHFCQAGIYIAGRRDVVNRVISPSVLLLLPYIVPITDDGKTIGAVHRWLTIPGDMPYRTPFTTCHGTLIFKAHAVHRVPIIVTLFSILFHSMSVMEELYNEPTRPDDLLFGDFIHFVHCGIRYILQLSILPFLIPSLFFSLSPSTCRTGAVQIPFHCKAGGNTDGTSGRPIMMPSIHLFCILFLLPYMPTVNCRLDSLFFFSIHQAVYSLFSTYLLKGAFDRVILALFYEGDLSIASIHAYLPPLPAAVHVFGR